MRSMTFAFATLLMTGSLVLVGCAGSNPSESEPPMADAPKPMADSVPILGKVAGDQLPIKSHGLGTIDQAAFDSLGLREKFEAEGVAVDFSKHSVVLFSLGEQPTGGFAADINGLQIKGNQLYIQATAIAPGDGATTTQALTYPYCAAAVEKLPAGLTVLSDITSLP